MQDEKERGSGGESSFPPAERAGFSWSALRVVFWYALGGSAWILLGDTILGVLGVGPERMIQVEMFKGMLFIALTAAFLYVLIRRYEKHMSHSMQRDMQAHISRAEGFPRVNIHPVFQMDGEGRLLYANEAGTPLLHAWGRRVGETLGEEWRRAAGEALREDAARALEVCCGGRTYDMTLVPLPESGVVNVYGFDVSFRKMIQGALVDSETRFQALLRSASDAIVSADVQGRIVMWNPAAERIFGYTEGEARGKPLSSLMPERYRAAHQEGLRRLREGGPPRLLGKTLELHGLRRDGAEFPIELSLARWENDGQPFYTGIVRDISERKKIEEELRQARGDLERRVEERTAALKNSQQMQTALVRALDGIVWEADAPDWRFSFVSGQAERILGYPVSEWLEDPDFWNKRLHPEDKNRAKAVCRDGINSQNPHEVDYRFKAADGRWVWLRDKVSVESRDGKLLKLRGLMVDITDDKVQEENFRRRQEALLALAKRKITRPDLSPALAPVVEAAAGALGVERAGVWLFRNERRQIECVQLCELSKGGAHESGAVLHAADYPSYFRALEENLAIDAHDAMRDPRTREFSEGYLKPLGITSMLDASIYSGGEVIGILCHEHVGPARRWSSQEVKFAASFADMAGRAIEDCRLAQIQADLAEHQRKLSTLISSLPGIAYRCKNDRDWTMEFISEGCFPLTGYPPADFVENRRITFTELIHPDDRDQVWFEVQRALGESRPFQLTYRITAANGAEKWVWEQGIGVCGEDGRLQALEGFITDITERKRAEEAMRESEEKLRTIIANAPIVLYAMDRRGVITFSDGRGLEAMGRTPGQSVGLSVFDLYADHPKIIGNVRRALAGEEFTDIVEVRGRILDVCYLPVRGSSGEVTGVTGITVDVTERKRAEASLRASEQRFRDMLENVQLISVLLDEDGQIIFCNDYLLSLTGYTREELHGRNWFEVMIPPEMAGEMEQRFRRNLREGTILPHYENPIRTKGGEMRLISWNNTVLRDSEGDAAGMASIGEDVTRRRELEQMLEASYAQVLHWSQHDALTGLVNQYHFQKILGDCIRNAQAQNGNFALVYLDFDHFKQINDLYGHLSGDRYLRHISGIIQNHLSPGQTAARIGGDELAILLPEANAADAEAFCESVSMEMKRAPLVLPDERLMLSASLGVALFPEHGRSATELLGKAEDAMSAVKQAGGGSWKFSGAELPPHVLSHAVEKDIFLSEAIREGRLLAAYQPVRRIDTGNDLWWEALARLRDPEGNLLEPMDFLYTAPLHVQACEVDLAMVSIGIDTLGRLRKDPVYRDLTMSFNLSPTSLQDPEFFGTITAKMDACGVRPRQVIFELSENALLADIHPVLPVINALHQTGIRFAIDDFGAGATSLRYLINLPLSFLKIDGAYIRPLPHDPRSRALVEGIMRIARQLRVAVVAEGVETKECLDAVTDLGVEYVQGYYLRTPQFNPWGEGKTAPAPVDSPRASR